MHAGLKNKQRLGGRSRKSCLDPLQLRVKGPSNLELPCNAVVDSIALSQSYMPTQVLPPNIVVTTVAAFHSIPHTRLSDIQVVSYCVDLTFTHGFSSSSSPINL